MHIRIIMALALLIVMVLPVRAQDAPVSSVGGSAITADAFQTRYTLEGWLQVREITAFAERFYEQNPEGGAMANALSVSFPVQLRSIYNPPRLGDTVLTSMEGDLVLQDLAAEQQLTVDPLAVDSLVMLHVALTEDFTLNDAGTLSDEQSAEFDAAVEAFYEEAQAFADATRDEVRTLFEVRALRQRFFEQVTDVDAPNDERSAAFQDWLQEQLAAADIQRRDDWQQAIPAAPDFGDLLNAELTRIVEATPD